MTDRLSDDDIARLMEAFNRHDSDGDGVISTEELGRVLHTLGQNPTDAELQVNNAPWIPAKKNVPKMF